jgi:hypothetical protein
MLNPFIIDQILRREREKAQDKSQQIPLELPLPEPSYRYTEPDEEVTEDRGVVIIDLM